MLENDALSFLQLPAVDTIVRYASAACIMMHFDAHLSALRFLFVLAEYADPDEVKVPSFFCINHQKLKIR